jgi:hypothetical protein
MKISRSTGFLITALVLLTVPAIAQHECDTIPAQTLQTARDAAGVVHQIECWNPVTGHTTFPLTPSSGGVTSVFGRTGAVVGAANDYSSITGLNLGDGVDSLLFGSGNATLTGANTSLFVANNTVQMLINGGAVSNLFNAFQAHIGEPLLIPSVTNQGTYTDSASQVGSSGSCLGSTGTATLWGACPLDINVQLSASQLNALAGTPVVGIAAPGAGKFINPIAVTVVYTAGSTPFTITGASVSFAIGPAPGASDGTTWFQANTTGMIDQSTSQYQEGFANNAIFPLSDFVNSSLDIFLTGIGPSLSAGNGTVNFHILYTIETAP